MVAYTAFVAPSAVKPTLTVSRARRLWESVRFACLPKRSVSVAEPPALARPRPPATAVRPRRAPPESLPAPAPRTLTFRPRRSAWWSLALPT